MNSLSSSSDVHPCGTMMLLMHWNGKCVLSFQKKLNGNFLHCVGLTLYILHSFDSISRNTQFFPAELIAKALSCPSSVSITMCLQNLLIKKCAEIVRNSEILSSSLSSRRTPPLVDQEQHLPHLLHVKFSACMICW